MTSVPLRLPDFFIVGHAKSGTTALYEMLRSHPQIFMPQLKEPWFFASDMQPRFQPPRGGALPRTLAEYSELFAAAHAGQRIGEASSSYLWSRTAAQRIAEVRPDPSIRGGFWVWAVCDNLRRSSALNAVLVAEKVLFGSGVTN